MKGIRPSDIQHNIPIHNPTLSDDEYERRIRAVAGEWISEEYEWDGVKRFSWDKNKSRIPLESLTSSFSYNELVRIWVDSCVMSPLTQAFEEKEQLLWKIQNCLWRYGCASHYEQIVQALDGLKRLPDKYLDLDIRIVHTVGTCAYSFAAQDMSVYLDGAFGLLLYYKNKHVLTVGFSFTREGILISQIQLKEKKGNRFLYRLPCHYLDMVIDLMANAFHNHDLYLVDGKSAVEAINRSYGGNHTLHDEVSNRIESFYNRPLSEFRRYKSNVERFGRKYKKLHKRQPKESIQAKAKEFIINIATSI